MPTVERTPVPEQFTSGAQGPSITEPQLRFILNLIDQRDLSASPKFSESIKALNEEQTEQFLESMRQQARGLTKVKAHEWIDRLKELPYKKTKRENAQAPAVPNGYYALEYEGDELNPIHFYKVRNGKDKTEKGGRNWEGFIFVERFSSDETFPVRGKERFRVLERIAADPLRAAQLYGQQMNHCAMCGRKLTRRLSRELGIGPVCATKHEWVSEAMIEQARATISARGENPDEEME